MRRVIVGVRATLVVLALALASRTRPLILVAEARSKLWMPGSMTLMACPRQLWERRRRRGLWWLVWL